MSDDDLPNHWEFLGKRPTEQPGPGEPARPPREPNSVVPAPGERPVEAHPRGKRNKRNKRRGRPAFVRFVLVPFLFLMILGIIAFVAGGIYLHSKALVYDLEELKNLPERTLVYDRNQELLGHVSGHGENRVIIPVDRVSQNFIQPLLAREDMRFYQHGGVDYFGVLRAVVMNLKSGSMDQGASTLTMQLARNTFGLKDKSIVRKLKEVAIARRLERTLEKDEILSYYVNRIYFGSGLYGIEKASQGFFMKSAADLSLGEGAMLAGVIRGPSLLNPFRDLDAARKVRDEVLERMIGEEMITREEAELAKAEEVSLRPPEKRFATGSYPLQAIHNFLDDSLQDEAIKLGGLRVYCSIDKRLQKAAEDGLENHLASLENRAGWQHPKRDPHSAQDRKFTDYVQGAVVCLDNRDGGILAYVGGRSFNESPFNRAVYARRQAGSTFKPFIYAVAFDRGGLLPGTYVSDDPVQYRQDDGRIWSPKNYDGTYQGNKPAAWGLIKSRNTMSIRVGQMAGMDNVKDLARKLLFGKIPSSPVSYLGAFEATPMTMTSAYSTFAARGKNYAPYLIDRIENSAGKVLFQNKVRGEQVLRESVAWMTTDVLEKVFTEGTARSARASYGYQTPAYGKTGTTNDNKDGWFVGYTDKVTTGVWIGLDNPKPVMYKGTGSSLALPVWVSVMKEADQVGYQGEPIAPPPGTSVVHLCRECGLRASRRTTDQEVYQMSLPRDLLPRGSCSGHQKYNIFTKSPDWFREKRREERGDAPGDDPPVMDVLKRFGNWLFNR